MKKITIYTRPCLNNHKHAAVNGRLILTKKYRDTKSAIQAEITAQANFEPLEGDVAVNIIHYFKNKVHGDIDAYLKVLLDAMTDIVYVDDKQVNELNVVREYDKEDPRTEIQIL